MQYKFNSANTSLETFARMTTIINPIAVTYFFEAMYWDIFKYLLAADSKDGELFSPILTYFGIIKTNSQGMLHLYCLVWLCSTFHITQPRE